MAVIDELLIRIKGDISELEDALDEADSEVSSFGEKMGSIGATVGKGLAVAGAAVVAIGAASVKAASDFETAFVAVRQDVNGTTEELDALERSIRDMGASGPVAATDLSAVAAQLGEVAGIAATAMPGAVDAVVKFSQATGTELGEATALFAEFVRTTGTAPESLDEIGSTLVSLASQFKAPEASLLAFSEKLAPIAQDLGIVQQDILGLGAAFVGAGVDAGRGATAVKDVLGDIGAAVAEGGDSLQGFADVAGITTDQFAALFKQDAAGAVALFVQGLQDLNAKGEAVGPVLAGLGIEAGPAADAFLRVAQSGQSVTLALDAANAAFAENTALGASAAIATETFAAQMATLKNTVLELGITIGEAILPAVSSLVSSIAPILTSLAPVVQELAGFIAGAFAELLPAIQPLLDALIGLITDLIPPLKAILGPVIEVAKVLAANLAPVVKALTPIIVKLADVLAAILEPILAAVADLLAAFLPVLADILDAFAPLIDIILDLVLMALKPFLDLLAPLMELLSPLFDILGLLAEVIGIVLTPVLKALAPIFNLIAIALKPLNFVLEALGAVFKFVAELLRDSLLKHMDTLVKVAETLRAVWEPIGEFFEKLWDGVKIAFETVAKAISGLWDGIVAGAKGALNLLIGGMNGLINGLNRLIDGINNVVEGGASLGGLLDVDVANIPHIPTIPHLDIGGQVLQDGLAVLHKGEVVMPAADVQTPFNSGMLSGPTTTVHIENVNVPLQVIDGDKFDPAMVASETRRALALELQSLGAFLA